MTRSWSAVQSVRNCQFSVAKIADNIVSHYLLSKWSFDFFQIGQTTQKAILFIRANMKSETIGYIIIS